METVVLDFSQFIWKYKMYGSDMNDNVIQLKIMRFPIKEH